LIANFLIGSISIFFLADSPNYWICLVLYGLSALAMDSYNVGTVLLNESGDTAVNNMG
jgi:hypothetical protein